MSEEKIIEGFENYSIDEDRVVRNLTTGRVMRANDNGRGYLTVGLSKGGKMFKRRVHRLFAKAFLPNPDNKPHINHINNIRSDNRLENLEWCTMVENMSHAARQGRMSSSDGKYKGEGHPQSKLTNDQVLAIKMLLSGTEFRQKEIATLFDTKQCTVNHIYSGHRWSHLQLPQKGEQA